MVGKTQRDELVDEVIREFRVSGNQDDAFDALAAARLGVSATDLHCLNIIENGRGLTAGEVAAQDGLTAGEVAARAGLTAGEVAAQAGLTAGEVAARAGLTAGAVTGVIDRLEKAGYVRRVPDPSDRRRVRVEVTPAFYAAADRIWGPTAADWHATLAGAFTSRQLDTILAFLRLSNEIGRRHLDRLRHNG